MRSVVIRNARALVSAKLGRCAWCTEPLLRIAASGWIVLIAAQLITPRHLQYFALACAGILLPAAPSRSTQSNSYFAEHWRGDLPLPLSVWLNGVVILALGVASSVLVVVLV